MAALATFNQPETSSETPASPETPNRIWVFFLVAGAAILPYLGSLRFGFVYDDGFQLALPAIRSWKAVPGYFINSIPGISVRYYRPLFFLWLRVNFFLWGARAWGWHLTSVALHGAVSIFVLLVLRRYFKDIRCAVAGALVFAAHPAHIETVAWISGCTDSLMALGLVSSLWLWMKNLEAPRIAYRLGSLFCCAFALLSKETAIVLPFLIALQAFVGIPPMNQGKGGFSNRLRIALWQTAPYAGVTAAFLAIRWWALSGVQGTPSWISNKQVILTVPSLLVFYLKHMIWPMRLSVFYDFPIVSRVGSSQFWLPLLALAAIAGGTWYWFWRTRDARIATILPWILGPVVPVCYIRIFQLDDFVHDRYLYLPVVGLAVLAGIVCEFLWKGESHSQASLFPAVGAGFVVACLALATAIQAEPWKDNLSLYSHAIQIAPRNTVGRHNLATAYAALGRNEEASSILRALLEDRPDMWQANYNYGCVNYQMGNLIVAEEYLRRAIRIDATDANQFLYLGLICLKEERLVEAAKRVEQAIARNPAGGGYHFTLGMIELRLGNVASAKAEMQKELKSHPENADRVSQAQTMFEQLKTGTP